MTTITKIILLFTIINACSTKLIGQENGEKLPIKSYTIKRHNKPLSESEIDKIYKNNPICKKYKELVNLDTLYWNQFKKVEIDSITQLQGVSANELAEKALDFNQSDFYPKKDYNLIGTFIQDDYYSDTARYKKMLNDNVKTKITVYDPGFYSNQLPNAQTEKCYFVNKSKASAELYYLSDCDSLFGIYSNLYMALDLDFLRMYNYETVSDELGQMDRRKWGAHKQKYIDYVPDDYKYYKAFEKDGTTYVILTASQTKSILSMATGSVFKYILINLNTNGIEKTGYYSKLIQNSRSVDEYSYETSYKLFNNQYFLDKVSYNSFKFLPKVNLISTNSIKFQVDSVITDPLKIKKISNAKADPRKVDYIEKLIQKDNRFGKNKPD